MLFRSYLLARTAYREERYKSTIRDLKRAFEINTRWASEGNAYLLLGSAYYETREDELAEQAISRAAEIGGRSLPLTNYLLGKLYYRQKRYDLAEKSLQRYISDPGDSTSLRDASELLARVRVESPAAGAKKN